MHVLTSISVTEIKARGSIKDADVLKLRTSYYEDGTISVEEAETLLDLNDACPVQDPAWAHCFVEMLTDYLVEQVEPRGYLTAQNSDWLTLRIAPKGKIESKTKLDLLVSVIDQARWVPASLVRFALDQVRWAIIDGTGPLRTAKWGDPHAVSEEDVELLRGIIYAFGGDGNVAVTRMEAEVLFAIDRLTAGRDNHPSWRDLFVKAIANCVMSVSGYATPAREIALAREAWLDGQGEPDLDNVLSGMVTGLRSVLAEYRAQSPEERAITRLTQQKVEIVTREAISVAEAGWLAEHLGRSGELTPNEHALLRFLKDESPAIDERLQSLVDRAMAA